MSTSEKKVREIEVEINEINSKLEDANAAVRAAQRKLNMANSTDGADPVLKQELQNRLAKQQAELNALNAQLAAKEKEANEVADRAPSDQPTSQENTAAKSETAGDSVKSNEGTDYTGTDTPVDTTEGDDESLDPEESDNITSTSTEVDVDIDGEIITTSEEVDLELEEDLTEDEETFDEDDQEALGEDTVVGFDEDGDPIYETDDGTGSDVVVGFDEEGNPIYSTGDSEDAREIHEKTAAEAPAPIPTKNRLHDYASYTYNIGLFMLSPDSHKSLTEDPQNWQPDNCLIASGGRKFIRNAEFNDDFYFSDLRMTTVVGMNARSRSTNAIDITFGIIEPYGLTLLDRIINASEAVGSKNYLELPYVLQIEFFGSRDDGSNDFSPIPQTIKRIPIKIIELKTRVSTKGAEYQVRAVPFNHQAFQETSVSVPINLEVEADTVESFFANNDEDVAKQASEKEELREQAKAFQQVLGPDGAVTDPEQRKIYQSELDRLAKAAGKPLKTTSFSGGINSWQRYQKEVGARKYHDTILFDIDADIGRSKIVKPTRNDPSRTKLKEPGTVDAFNAQKSNAVGPNFSTSSFSISAGTSIVKIIDMVMRNSEYIVSQVSDPANTDPQALAKKLQKPLMWYKVIPQITIGPAFDPSTNRWTRTITYFVRKTVVDDSKHPFGPAAKPKGWVKEYNYIYTGKNSDIIDFQIDFDTLYYTAVSINRANAQSIAGQGANPETNNSTIKNPSGGKNSAFPRTYHPTSGDVASDAGFGGDRDSVTKTVTDIQRSIYSGSRGDMLNLKMKIVGDPDFIKQDDLYMNPSMGDEYEKAQQEQFLPESGSLAMDRGEIYTRVTFKTPTDMDETTGLVRKDGRYIESSFSGTYRILTVDSELRDGRFEQTIDMVRIFDDYASAEDIGRGGDADAQDGGFYGEVIEEEEQDADEDENVEESLGQETVVGFDDDGNPIIETDDGTGEDIAQALEDEDLNDIADAEEEESLGQETVVGFDDDGNPIIETEDGTGTDIAEWNDQLDSQPENRPVDTYDQYANQQTQSFESTSNNSPTQGVTSVPNGVKQDPVTGAFTYVDSTGAVNNLPASTNEALQAQVNALKDGNPVTYTDYDRNIGWVQKTYDPQTQTHTILPPATAPFSIPTDGIRDSSDQVLLMKSTRKADREAREREAAQAALAQGVAPNSKT